VEEYIPCNHSLHLQFYKISKQEQIEIKIKFLGPGCSNSSVKIGNTLHAPYIILHFKQTDLNKTRTFCDILLYNYFIHYSEMGYNVGLLWMWWQTSEFCKRWVVLVQVMVC